LSGMSGVPTLAGVFSGSHPTQLEDAIVRRLCGVSAFILHHRGWVMADLRLRCRMVPLIVPHGSDSDTAFMLLEAKAIWALDAGGKDGEGVNHRCFLPHSHQFGAHFIR
jgi:hypothetical protein